MSYAKLTIPPFLKICRPRNGMADTRSMEPRAGSWKSQDLNGQAEPSCRHYPPRGSSGQPEIKPTSSVQDISKWS